MKGVVIDFAKSLGKPRVPTITDLICNDNRGNADSGRATDVYEENDNVQTVGGLSWIDHKNPNFRSKKTAKRFLKKALRSFLLSPVTKLKIPFK